MNAHVVLLLNQESRFSKCDVCAAIKEGRERTLNPVVRKWLGTIMSKHIALEKCVYVCNIIYLSRDAYMCFCVCMHDVERCIHV